MKKFIIFIFLMLFFLVLLMPVGAEEITFTDVVSPGFSDRSSINFSYTHNLRDDGFTYNAETDTLKSAIIEIYFSDDNDPHPQYEQSDIIGYKGQSNTEYALLILDDKSSFPREWDTQKFSYSFDQSLLHDGFLSVRFYKSENRSRYGYDFGDFYITRSTLTLTINRSTTHTITASGSDGGSISPSGEVIVNHEAEQSFTITPLDGYHIETVLIDGNSVGAVPDYTFSNVSSDHTIEAHFAINTYTILASAAANGSISPSGEIIVNHDSVLTFAIIPEEGYHIEDVLVDGNAVGAVPNYTFSNVTSVHTIEAHFAINTYTITSNAGSNGNINPIGIITLTHGSGQPFDISADEGYNIVDVVVDGESKGAINSYSFTNVISNHTINAIFTLNEHIIIATADVNGTISPAGSLIVTHCSDQPFDISADEGYNIVDVVVDDESKGAVNSYSFINVISNHTIHAKFAINIYTLTSSADKNGSISPSGEKTVDHGSEQTFTITPNAGYYIEDVLVDGNSVGAAPSFTFSNVTSDHTIEASFAINTYTITAKASNGGSVSPFDEVPVKHGIDQTFTITPNAGYYIEDVLVDGNSVGAVPSFTFNNVISDHTIEANYAINTYIITAKASDDGSMAPSGEVTVKHGIDRTFTIKPAEGYYIGNLLIDGAVVDPVTEYTFENVTSGHTIEVVFAAEESYRFERMWPTLQQPWYFMSNDVAVDAKGNVYVVDGENHLIRNYTSSGQFISSWGGRGTEPGHFNNPWAVAIDNYGNVYVVDRSNHRIQKFTSDGRFINEWGHQGSQPGEFHSPGGIAISPWNTIYISDTYNNRIQMFDPNGRFLNMAYGYNKPKHLAFDQRRMYLYVVDSGNYYIWKLSSSLAKIARWGGHGEMAGQFLRPCGIAVDNYGYVYVSDEETHFIQRFYNRNLICRWLTTPYENRMHREPKGLAVDYRGHIYISGDSILEFYMWGHFFTKWTAAGSSAGYFSCPYSLDLDTGRNVYVADRDNHRVQKFNPNGQFSTEWGSYGMEDGQFVDPISIAVNGNGHVYVGDRYSIQKFDSNGNFLTRWGEFGTEESQFKYVTGLAVDSEENVYSVDMLNSRIQKFTADGQFVNQWGSEGSGTGQFYGPTDIAIDSEDNIYVADGSNYRIQKFDSDGNFLHSWSCEGNYPQGIAIDSDGYINVVFYHTSVVRKYAKNGYLVTEWGEKGNAPGQMVYPNDLAVSSDGRVFVADTGNHRIQVFNKVTTGSNNKAIIVAGGGAYKGNSLWKATEMTANSAYWALTYQGFSKESICYLSSDINLDLDNNGELDDVDGEATNTNLQQAITSWATDADTVVVYLVGHGGVGAFQMSTTQTLSAIDLDSWLDSLQATISGKVILIYDACESGSFLPALSPPNDKDRIVITSTSSGEVANFITHGTISFSNYFWTHIFKGFNLKEAFDLAKDAVGDTGKLQNPLLDDNGNGKGNEDVDGALAENAYIGNGTVIQSDAPIIGSVSPEQTINNIATAFLSASDVTDNDGVARVWAVIKPPFYSQGASDNPLQNLPSVDLILEEGDKYEGEYDGFNIEGTYQIAIYAMDRVGNTSIPKLTTVSVGDPIRRKAIIVAGSWQTDPLWPAIENCITLAYEALSFQGYTNDDIYFMCPVTSSEGVTCSPSLEYLEGAIKEWVGNSQDLVLYMIGNGAFETFKINENESLSPTELDQWLDNLQDSVSGKITVIYDAPYSGSFLPLLTPPSDKERILISSTSNLQSAHFISSGDISFSKFFWSRILNGVNVREAFLHARNAVEYSCEGQSPQLDDNGNGVGNENSDAYDGYLAKHYTIGFGIMLAGNDPIAGSVSPHQTIYNTTSCNIWVEDTTTTSAIARVFAVITPPSSLNNLLSESVTDLPTIDLVNKGNGLFEGTYNNFSNYGLYSIAAYVKDVDGDLSMVKESSVLRADGLDVYEEDDTPSQANVIIINDDKGQQHNFHDEGDQDWVMFYGISGVSYEIKTENLGVNCNTMIKLYNSIEISEIALRDDKEYGEGELLLWECPADGVYYVMISLLLMPLVKILNIILRYTHL